MMRKWSKRSLDNLAGIHPDLRRVMDRALRESPVDFTVIDGLRTEVEQRELVRQGKSKTMNSRHLTGHAVDIVPSDDLDGDGKVESEEMFNWPQMRKLAAAVKSAAFIEGVAIVWGGDWRSFKDGPHFELDRKVYPAGAKQAQTLTRPVDHVKETPKSEHVKPSADGWLSKLIAAIVAALWGKK